MQVQNNTPSFTSYRILTETFQYLPSKTKPIVAEAINKVKPNLKEISKGISLKIGVHEDNPTDLFVELTKRKFFIKTGSFLETFPAKNLAEMDFEKFLRNLIPAFKDFVKLARKEDQATVLAKMIEKLNQPMK